MIGLIGIGLVGSALVQRFRDAGIKVIGYDIDRSKVDSAAEFGLMRAASPEEVVKKARRVILSLPDSDVVDDVVNGGNGIAPALEPDDLLIDTTTADPERSVAVADRLRDAGVHFLDATILGSSKIVADGEALSLVGGERKQLERARDILDCFSKHVYHMGPNGKGAEAKLIVNLVLGLNRLVLAEGLMLGERSGIDQKTLLDVLKDGVAYSRVMDSKGQKMIDGDFSTEARLSQHLKDVGLILDHGMRSGARLPVSALHAEVLRAGVEAGMGDEDNSAVIKALERFAGV